MTHPSTPNTLAETPWNCAGNIFELIAIHYNFETFCVTQRHVRFIEELALLKKGGSKRCWCKQMLGQKEIKVKKSFAAQKFWAQKKIFGPQRCWSKFGQ